MSFLDIIILSKLSTYTSLINNRMGRAKIDREAFKVGYKGLGQVPVVNKRPLVCWVSSARSADAREARFLGDFK